MLHRREHRTDRAMDTEDGSVFIKVSPSLSDSVNLDNQKHIRQTKLHPTDALHLLRTSRILFEPTKRP